MASIEINRVHKLPPKKAKAAAEASARKLAEEFDLKYRWEDAHKLSFERPGARGQLVLSKGHVHLAVSLGLLLLPFRARIEHAIVRNLDELFGKHA